MFRYCACEVRFSAVIQGDLHLAWQNGAADCFDTFWNDNRCMDSNSELQWN